ncbi:SH3 domain-containing protein [Salinisphaera orenii]|uniref:hypothetical protein n=1 Tax=Salinisphaera orenii TaxID=856731 RepID=UPI0013A65E73
MEAVVIEAYEQPYANPICVSAGESVTPDFDKFTDIPGWVWCTGTDGRSGWTPLNWLTRSSDGWRIDRNFNAIELTIAPGELLHVALEESDFFWVKKQDGKEGWVPCECVSTVDRT